MMNSQFITTTPNTTIHVRITHPHPSKITAKPLLIFLHYWGGSSSTWHKFTDPESPTSLSAVYPTLAIDLRGWGLSGWPTGASEGTSPILDMAKDIAAVLAKLSEDVSTNDLFASGIVLVGHSMGAKVALATISTLSPGMAALLKGLVLIAPAPPTALALPPELRKQQQAAYSNEASIRWTVENVLANTERLTASDVELIVRDSLGGHAAAKQSWPGPGMREDVSEAVSSVLRGCQCLRASVLVGELDVVEPSERVEAGVVRFLRGNGVEVKLKMVEGVKHLVPLEDPKSIYHEICRF